MRCELSRGEHTCREQTIAAAITLDLQQRIRRASNNATTIEHHQWRLAMELILIIVVLVLLFGGGGYWGRSRGHW
jgi:hypothetical protein